MFFYGFQKYYLCSEQDLRIRMFKHKIKHVLNILSDLYTYCTSSNILGQIYGLKPFLVTTSIFSFLKSFSNKS